MTKLILAIIGIVAVYCKVENDYKLYKERLIKAIEEGSH